MEKILEKEDVLLIKKTNLVRKYKEDASEGFKGKSYRVYAFGDKAFAVHEDDDFHKDFKEGEVCRVLINVTDEGWSLANHVTFNQALKNKSKNIELESITVESFKLRSVTQYEAVS